MTGGGRSTVTRPALRALTWMWACSSTGRRRLDRVARLQVELEDLFAPLSIDSCPSPRSTPSFNSGAIDGHRVFAANPERADRRELVIMRRAAELLPIQRAIERERFGVATS